MANCTSVDHMPWAAVGMSASRRMPIKERGLFRWKARASVTALRGGVIWHVVLDHCRAGEQDWSGRRKHRPSKATA